MAYMKGCLLSALAALAVAVVGAGVARSQTPPAATGSTPPATATPAAPAATSAAPATATPAPPASASSAPAENGVPPPAAPANLSAAELEKLAMPIALHPDNLIAIILPASVYPLEIVQAARFVKDTNNIPAIDNQSWDDN